MQGVYVSGYELQKAQSNSPEDYFNKSEFGYQKNGVSKVFTVLYLRFFEENISKFVPFEENPMFTIENNPIELKHIVAYVLFHKNQEKYAERKKVYVSNEEEFSQIFHDIDFDKLQNELRAMTIHHSAILTK